ncbi:MAG: FAD-binding protein, partial [Clostridium sp.]|nr:FAD-binding protein [Clostridium sp.]
MRKTLETDVLVLGSGIAGISAAIYAAKTGAKVTIASSVHMFSGSTFYPGTWGLGLIGPENEGDVENLIDTILSLGKGVAVEPMVRTFVENLNPTMDEFEALGINLERPAKGTEGETEYIPCFDDKHRRWRGLTKKNLSEALPKILRDLNITPIPFFEAVELIKVKGQVLGAVGIKDQKEVVTIKAKATVLCTGGLSGLYRRYLTTDDVSGTGLAMALKVGAKGINLEFTQMMLGFVNPGAKTVHNEKTFKASRFYNEKNQEFLRGFLPDSITLEEVLEKRSEHGPFSSETMSKYLDLGLYTEILGQKEKSITLRYDESKLNQEADFVKTYFNWLKQEKSIEITDDIKIAPFMHASNGGIEINMKAETGVPGLYAAGEVTGGMHGA